MYLPELSDEEFVVKHEKLVYKICSRFYKELEYIKSSTGFEFEDLTQIGLIALLDARKRFDVNLGCAFSTYLYRKIWGTVKNNLGKYTKIKINTRVKIISKDIYMKELDLDVNDIMDMYNVNYTIAQEVLNLSSVKSLDEKLYDDNGKDIDLHDIVHSGSFEVDLINHLLLYEFWETLPDIEKVMFKLYFFNDVKQVTIAAILGISQGYVVKIIKRIREKYRDFLLEETK